MRVPVRPNHFFAKRPDPSVNPLRRVLRALLQWPLALIILFEEWGWEPLQRLLAVFARLPVVAWVERKISALPPYRALAVFVLPTVLLLPVKLLALWLIGHGRYAIGATVIIVAKIVGTAIVARLFTLTRPALLTLSWFARPYARWVRWKDGLLDQMRASLVWRSVRILKRNLSRSLGRWFGAG